MKSNLSLVAVIALALPACVSTNTTTPAKLAYAQRIQPVCRGEKECELMWSAAKQWVEENSPYRIKLLTNDYLETYSPVGGSPLLGMVISKVPNKDGSYRLRSKMWCDNIFGCSPDAVDAVISLNKAVNEAK